VKHVQEFMKTAKLAASTKIKMSRDGRGSKSIEAEVAPMVGEARVLYGELSDKEKQIPEVAAVWEALPKADTRVRRSAPKPAPAPEPEPEADES
jgi:hypothetical protein